MTQTHQRFELLVCEDGSTEEAKALLERLAAENAHMRLIHDPSCLDLAKKLNLCLKEAKGQYIARMDDDDWSHPNRLEKQLHFLKEHGDISFVGCNVALVRSGQHIGERRLPSRPAVEDFYFTQPYIHPSLLFRREALEKVGGYSEDPHCELCEDYDLLLRMYQAGLNGANLQEVLLDYTVSDGANRRMRHRLNEARTRYRRFRDLGKLPGAWPYILKPIVVGLIPRGLLSNMKNWGVGGREHSP